MKWTALDALSYGLRSHLVADACRGVNLQPGDVDRAILELKRAGVCLTDSAALLK